MATLVLALMAFATALVFNGPSVNLMLLSCTAGALLLWVGILFWREFGAGQLRFPAGVGSAVMAAMLGWMLLSVLWSSWQQISFIYAMIIGAMPLAFLLWLKDANADALWNKLWIGLLLLTLAAGSWGLVEYSITAKRANGPFLDANAYGALFNLFVFPCFFRYLAMSRSQNRPFWRMRTYEAIIAVLLAALFATYSRGAIGALVLMLPLALALGLKHYGRVIVPALLTVAMVAGATYLAVAAYPQQTIDREVFELSEDTSTQLRLHMWQSTWEIYKGNPVLGTGLGTYQAQYGAHRDPRENGSSGDLAHNDYLQVLQEGGPPLLILLLAVGIMTLSLLYRCFRLSSSVGLNENRKNRLLESCGLLLGVLALFAHAAVNFIFYVLPLSLVMGLYLAQAYRQCETIKHWSVPLPMRATAARAALTVILALPAAALIIDGIAAAVFFRQPPSALRGILAPDPQAAYELAQVIAALRPGNAVPAFYLAEVNKQVAAATKDPVVRQEFSRRARDEYARVLMITDRNAYSLTEMARLLSDDPRLQQGVPGSLSSDPETLLRRAIRVDPTYEPAYLALAALYQEQGDIKKAYVLLARDAMAWTSFPLGSRGLHIAIIEQALDLALKLNDHDGARALANSLLKSAPNDARAQAVLSRYE